MKHYLKDKKVSVWKQGEHKTGVIYYWDRAIPGKVWAYYRQSGGRVSIETSNGLLWQKVSEEAVFVFNNDVAKLLDINSMIMYNHKLYTITNIDDFEGYKGETRFLVELARNYEALDTYYPGIVDD
ncbi:MAG: hypothetical protein IKB61_00620 [Elusimicrobiaceae bacterium]|nr:hypothetical protein [Elusimicrobiaceae bacterium]